MVSVSRWLDTFTCSKYADQFERLGYSTLQSICQLNSTQLQNLGVSSADICTIMENILLLKQSVKSLNSPQYLDLTSEPPSSSFLSRIDNFNSSSVSNGLLPSTESTSFNNFLPQQPPKMIYRDRFYDIHSPRFYSLDQQQFIYSNQRMMMHAPWNDHQQFPHPNMTNQNSIFINQQQQPIENPSLSSINELYSHPLESLERLVLLPDSQIIDPKSVVNEIHNSSSPLSNTPIVSNLLTNGLKRCSSNDERNELIKKSRINTKNNINTEDSIINKHPVVTSLLTRSLNNSISQTPLPSITSLQQKHNI